MTKPKDWYEKACWIASVGIQDSFVPVVDFSVPSVGKRSHLLPLEVSDVDV